MASTSKYWEEFWTQGNITDNQDPQLKVGRSKKGEPIHPELWQQTLDHLAEKMQISNNDDLLDIGAGSGMISIPFSKKVRSVTALDLSERLLAGYTHVDKIKTIAGNANEVTFGQQAFSKAVIYFALQHFTEGETVSLFKRVHGWLKEGGLFYCGDVPDVSRRFAFFNNSDRKTAFFQAAQYNKPIIGTWFHKSFLQELGKSVGFREVEVFDQPSEFYNAHYRFDVLLQK